MARSGGPLEPPSGGQWEVALAWRRRRPASRVSSGLFLLEFGGRDPARRRTGWAAAAKVASHDAFGRADTHVDRWVAAHRTNDVNQAAHSATDAAAKTPTIAAWRCSPSPAWRWPGSAGASDAGRGDDRRGADHPDDHAAAACRAWLSGSQPSRPLPRGRRAPGRGGLQPGHLPRRRAQAQARPAGGAERGRDRGGVAGTTEQEAGQGLTRQAVEQGVDLVLAAGGDGTVMACVTGLAASGVPWRSSPPAPAASCSTSTCQATSTTWSMSRCTATAAPSTSAPLMAAPTAS